MNDPKNFVVYLSGPISRGDKVRNFAEPCAVQVRLMKQGFSVHNPMLTMMLPGNEDIAHKDWIALDLPMVERCDAVYRLPGESRGADQEVSHAKSCGIPVVYSDASLFLITQEDANARVPDED